MTNNNTKQSYRARMKDSKVADLPLQLMQGEDVRIKAATCAHMTLNLLFLRTCSSISHPRMVPFTLELPVANRYCLCGSKSDYAHSDGTRPAEGKIKHLQKLNSNIFPVKIKHSLDKKFSKLDKTLKRFFVNFCANLGLERCKGF